MREDKLARGMFFTGCLGLPLLWFMNTLYFRKKVYGPIWFLDGKSDGSDDQNVTSMIADSMPDMSGLGLTGTNSDSDSDSEESEDDGMSAEDIQKEVNKWVYRSTIGSSLSFVVLLSWIITFQAKKDSFGYEWFMMSQYDGDTSGW